MFFRKSAGCLLVYDCTNEDSFYALESWAEKVLESADSKITVMLIANKIDLPDKKISHERGEEYARSKGWAFMEVSAKTDFNITSAFKQLVT